MTAPARDAVVLEFDPLESKLEESVDWLLIKEGAIDGLRERIAVEERGMEIDRAAGREEKVTERLARLEQTQRALNRAMKWQPLREPPTRRR